jgi:hypothetical protein
VASTKASPLSKKMSAEWINNWNSDPKPFIWTKTAEEILHSLALRQAG